jgi:hypothetical protein
VPDRPTAPVPPATAAAGGPAQAVPPAAHVEPVAAPAGHAALERPLRCFRCGSPAVTYQHCKVFCRACGALVENCAGD